MPGIRLPDTRLILPESHVHEYAEDWSWRQVFSKATAYAGILGNVLLIVVEIILTLKQMLPDCGDRNRYWYWSFDDDLVLTGWTKAAPVRLSRTKWSTRKSSRPLPGLNALRGRPSARVRLHLW